MSAPALRTIFAGGWNAHRQGIVNAIELPGKTRCYHCENLKPATPIHFAEKRLKELRESIAAGQASVDPAGSWIICRKCTGGQVAELECCICEEFKGLDGFTKAQRRDPDHARCKDCVANHLENEPIHGVDDWDRDHEDNESEDSMSNYHEDTDSASESAGGARLSDYHQGGLTNENLHVHDISTGGRSTKQSASLASTNASIADTARNPSQAPVPGVGKWQKMAGKAPSSQPAFDATFVGYDNNGRAHTQVRAPSTTCSDSSDGSVATTTAERHDARLETTTRSKFAKVKGTKGKPVAYRPEKTHNRTVKLNDYDEDEDEADYEDPYFYI